MNLINAQNMKHIKKMVQFVVGRKWEATEACLKVRSSCLQKGLNNTAETSVTVTSRWLEFEWGICSVHLTCQSIWYVDMYQDTTIKYGSTGY